ncbi:MAG: hypothetical protein IPJ82_21720 [Lewinellaceae bacterium]|nr:hypothetical protein [Lewinellaceae bacterium]
MNEPFFQLIPEDNGHKMLMEVLRFRKCNFAKGINNVLWKIENNFDNRFAVGIVDDDKFKSSHFKKYSTIIAESDKLIQLNKPETKHFLIVIQPAFEKWVWDQSVQKEILPSKYSFHNFKTFATLPKMIFYVRINKFVAC